MATKTAVAPPDPDLFDAGTPGGTDEILETLDAIKGDMAAVRLEVTALTAEMATVKLFAVQTNAMLLELKAALAEVSARPVAAGSPTVAGAVATTGAPTIRRLGGGVSVADEPEFTAVPTEILEETKALGSGGTFKKYKCNFNNNRTRDLAVFGGPQNKAQQDSVAVLIAALENQTMVKVWTKPSKSNPKYHDMVRAEALQ